MEVLVDRQAHDEGPCRRQQAMLKALRVAGAEVRLCGGHPPQKLNLQPIRMPTHTTHDMYIRAYIDVHMHAYLYTHMRIIYVRD